MTGTLPNLTYRYPNFEICNHHDNSCTEFARSE